MSVSRSQSEFEEKLTEFNVLLACLARNVVDQGLKAGRPQQKRKLPELRIYRMSF